MKKISFSFLLFLGLNCLFADPIEDFTLADAKRIVAYLQENPFLIDYCDCCNDVRSEGEAAIPAKLIRVIDTEIVSCEYNAERYSIRISGEILASGIVEDAKMTNISFDKGTENEEYNTLLSANYFFCADNRKIGQIGIISKDDKLYKEYNCGGIKSFPSPDQIQNSPSISQYVKWYRKNARD